MGLWTSREPPAGNGSGDPHLMAINGNSAAQLRYLATILAQLRGDVAEIAVTDGVHQQLVLDDFPFAGRKRLIVNRRGSGNPALSVPTTGVRVFKENVSALGRSIVNRGTVEVLLYGVNLGVTPPADAGTLSRMLTDVPAWSLQPAGGAWDGRNGASAWMGHVSAFGVSGSGLLAIAEY